MNSNEQRQEETVTTKENDMVVDSNAEIYMLTPEAHVALKSMHQRGTADLLFRSNKKQPKKEQEASSESVGDNNTQSSSASSSSSGGADDRETQLKSRISTRLPPALDIRHLRSAGRQLLSVATASARAYKSLSPADTLVPNKPDRVERSSTSSVDSDRSEASLQEVDIPTGDLGGLLNTWTVLADDNKPPLPIQTEEGGYADEEEGSYRHGMSYTSRQQMQLRRIYRRRWGAMRSDDFTELMLKGDNRAQSPRAIRRYPSAPSIYEQLSDRHGNNAIESMASEPTGTVPPSSSFGFGSLESRQLAMHRPSLPLARDEWNGPLTAASLFNRSSMSSNRDSSSRFSDLTVTSSITGGSFLRGMNAADQALSIFSSGTTPRSQNRTSLVQDTADSPITASAFPAPIRTTDLASNIIGPQGLVSAPPTSTGSIKQLQRSLSGLAKSSSAHSRKSESSEKRSSRPLTLWRNTVSSDLLATLTPEAIAQQEAIFELINTEHDYLHDLDMIDAVFVDPLTDSSQPSILADNRPVKEFLDILFYNYQQLIDINRQLANRLQERQQESDTLVVSGIGDIMDEWADDLSALVDYSVHVPVAQCELESELLRSPELAQFLRDAEHAPGARKLPIQSFIGRPATRFARYPLLLNAIAKSQPTDSLDTQHLMAAIDKVRQALTEIDKRSGEQASRLRIRQISQRLELVGGARQSLALESPTRKLIREGRFVDSHGQSSVVLVFLFDNSLIMATEERVSYAKGVVRYVADERIIPISMLDVHVPIEQHSGALGGIRGVLGLQQTTGNKMSTTSSSSSLKQMNRQNSTPILQAAVGTKQQQQQQENSRLPLAFVHIGCRSLCRTLLASSEQERQQWVSAASQRVCIPQTLVEAHSELRLLSDRDFVLSRMPLCSSTFMSSTSSGCQMVLYGNRDGLHMGIHGVPTSVMRVSHTGCVHRIQVLRAYNMVAVLSDSSLLVYSLSAIERATVGEPGGVLGHKVASSVSFFDVGTYMNAPLLVLMKAKSGGRSHFKCLQPWFNSDGTAEIDKNGEEEGPAESLRLLYQGSRASLHLIGEFSIPGRTRQVYFLRRKLCVVGARGFEIVDVKSCQLLRSLPDPLDDDFCFVDHGGEALAICKVGREFLLCFEAFAFFIDNFGRRSRPQVFVRWEHRPQSVVFRHPYMVAINPVFLEVRHMETGVLLSVVRLKGGRCLNPQSRSSALHVVVGPDASRCRVVPGLAGPQGDREFPEGMADHYRIVEIKLPPLKVL